MSSTTTSECLLDTLVTWHDVEGELQKSLKTNATFGEKKKAECLGSMKGFTSRIALVEPDWANRLPEDDLPDKFIVKALCLSLSIFIKNFQISSTLGFVDMFDILSFLKPDLGTEKSEKEKVEEQKANEDLVKRYHNLEVGTYKIIATENNPNLRTIKVYASRALSETSPIGFLVCEYIPNVYSLSLYATIPYKDMLPVIDTVAAFSAMGERISEEEKKVTYALNQLENIIWGMFPEDAAVRIRPLLLEALGEAYTEKIDATIAITNMICGRTGVLENYSTISEFLGHSPVLMHTDLWAANLLYVKDPKDSKGSPDFKALIDFQTTSLSSPGLDVCTLMITCLSVKDRKMHRKEFLNKYYEHFQANLKEVKVPYTLEQLFDSYDLYFVPIAVMNLPIVWALAKHDGRDEALNNAREQMIGVMEELLVVQEKNLRKFPKFFDVSLD